MLKFDVEIVVKEKNKLSNDTLNQHHRMPLAFQYDGFISLSSFNTLPEIGH